MIQDGIPENNIEAVHNFIDMDNYNVEVEDDGYAFYFGRLIKEKGIFTLLEAVKGLKDKKLLIAGDGPDLEKIKEYLNKNNMQENVKLLGYIDSDKVKEYVRKSRFIIVPSIWYENCPYSVLETLAIGKPIIGSNLGGIPELVKNNESGLIYTYNKPKELQEKMRVLFENKELADELGKNAKQIAKEEYSKESYYNKIINIYEGAVKNGK